ncbi:hypothetical protein FQN52_009331 [Onygenales sp. PD_12]|nr:hypothetical protein FQN52_009331 [Onygenales sp. PD_12]
METPTSPISRARASATWKVKSGFYRLSDLISQTTTQLLDELESGRWEAEEEAEGEENGGPPPTEQELDRLARQIVIPLWKQQLEIQQAWPGPDQERTVAEKLASGFEVLERRWKILARMNVGCCRTCGIAEVGEDREDDDDYDGGEEARTVGYVFFHEQVTMGLGGGEGEGEGLMLYYGSFTKSEKKNEAVARRVVQVLRRAGLRVEWEGDVGRGIEVLFDEWRNRLPVEEGDEDEEDEDYFDGEGGEGGGGSGSDLEGEDEDEDEDEDGMDMDMDYISDTEITELLQEADEPW